MTVQLYIELDNAAFQDGNRSIELARILKHLGDSIEYGRLKSQAIKDINGNTVGQMIFERREND